MDHDLSCPSLTPWKWRCQFWWVWLKWTWALSSVGGMPSSSTTSLISGEEPWSGLFEGSGLGSFHNNTKVSQLKLVHNNTESKSCNQEKRGIWGREWSVLLGLFVAGTNLFLNCCSSMLCLDTFQYLFSWSGVREAKRISTTSLSICFWVLGVILGKINSSGVNLIFRHSYIPCIKYVHSSVSIMCSNCFRLMKSPYIAFV